MRSNRLVSLSLLGAIVLGRVVFAGAKEKSANVGASYFQSLMQQQLTAWEKLDPAQAAKFYDQDAGDVFFDLAPMKYDGWKDYDAGVKKTLAPFSSVKFILGDDVKVHRHGALTWATATWTADAVTKAGEKQSLAGRWTLVWEKRGSRWLVVHEHFSMPIPQTAP